MFSIPNQRKSRLMMSVSPKPAGLRQIDECFSNLRAPAADVVTSIELLAELTGCQLIGVRLAYLEVAMRRHVVLFKGEAWPGNAGRDAMHRSPSVAALAPSVVLTLDAL